MSDTEEDQRCKDCGFLHCICFDDDDQCEDEDVFDCHMGPYGYCGAAGSEYCDWECPLHNSYFGKALG